MKAQTEAGKEMEGKGLNVEEKNKGRQLVLKKDEKTVDYWPSSEKWYVRGDGTRGKGKAEVLVELGV